MQQYDLLTVSREGSMASFEDRTALPQVIRVTVVQERTGELVVQVVIHRSFEPYRIFDSLRGAQQWLADKGFVWVVGSNGLWYRKTT